MLYIGSDPEFVFSKNGRIVPAYQILHQAHPLETDIGLDGAIATGEIRPQYSASIYQHISNILMLKAEIQSICNRYQVDAVAPPLYQGKSLGGHIHISTNSRANITDKMISAGIKLQFLALPAAKFIWGRQLYSRYYHSDFKYGSPYDIRSDWGKNHIELRMLPSFLGLNDKNLYAFFEFYINGMYYLLKNKLEIPIIKSDKPQTGPLSFLNSNAFPRTEAEVNKQIDYMYNFALKNRIGFAIQLYKKINKYNDFIVARHSNVHTDYKEYLGIAYYLSQAHPRKEIEILHSNKNEIVSHGNKIIVKLNNRIYSKDYFGKSKSLASQILKRI